MQVNAEIFRRAVCFTMTMRSFSNRRKADVNKLTTPTEVLSELAGQQSAAEKKSRLKLSKQLIKSDEYDAIKEYQREVYQWCVNRSQPSFFKEGVYLVRNEMVPEFEAKLNEARAHIGDVLVPALVAKYPEQIEEAQRVLGDQFNYQDYPPVTDLQNRFGVEWNWIAFGVPDSLPEELRAAEAAKIESKFAAAEAEIMAALREGFCEVVSHVSERLTTAPGERPKVFRDTLFEDLTEFIETFKARNLVEDKELGELVTQARNILSQVSGENSAEKAQYVRDASVVRDVAAKRFESMRVAVDTMIKTQPLRQFQFDDEKES